jgi:hypothetical protein
MMKPPSVAEPDHEKTLIDSRLFHFARFALLT